MSSHRVARLGGELKREIAAILEREVKDPRLEMVSVVAVNIAPDGCAAHIYVSPLSAAHSKDEVAAALGSAAGYIRRELGHRLKTRSIPELFFHVDESIAYGVRMTTAIERQIEADEQAAAGRPPEDPDKYKD